MYIIISLIALTCLCSLFFANKFPPHSTLIKKLQKKRYRKVMAGVLIISLVFLSYGIYNNLYSSSEELDITLKDEQYRVLGDIGNVGYFSGEQIIRDQKTNLYLASWRKLDLNQHTEFRISYPSGRKEIWLPSVSVVECDHLTDKYGIQEVYKLSPYLFIEKGDIDLSIQENGDQIAEISVKVSANKEENM
ncbi:hypothetical protein SAMN05421676_102314 [Salinibacillus kushneri]|uniref:Uncharacterized protein n=1 Tax=Salinibacillus kushneri TaxID=237682 RepID=A0A1I0AZZ9_9BACI|nr:hypothetical protein [Salinibacillus kushneri]SET00039.1 hypothetical protein SAMN05421676_102314 [Salinibacillus kushneri]